MSKRVWWILGGVVVVIVGAWIYVTEYVVPRTNAARREGQGLAILRGFGGESLPVRSSFEKGWEVGVTAGDTTVYYHKQTGEALKLVRWPKWYARHPLPTTESRALMNSEDALKRFDKVREQTRLKYMSYVVESQGEWQGESAKGKTLDDRHIFFIRFRETKKDPRFVSDGLRSGYIHLCAQTGAVVRFQLDIPCDTGPWVLRHAGDSANQKIEESWSRFTKAGDIKLTKIEGQKEWILKNPDPRSGRVLSAAWVVRGFDQKGDLRCIGTLDGPTGEVLNSECSTFPKNADWRGVGRKPDGGFILSPVVVP
jgi:hypothetical protein